ncbi:response regulator transcription factor [Saccharicrinis sp. FJH62]|uniref:response regulator transcription factor n=1 Tax=Saccharicrinis sp. FJH62 TaxID=3344657 RepID=UPI0035D46F50
MKILVIEDEIDLLLAINNFLVKEEYICELAESYSKAEEKLFIYEYDLILLDISLPDGNGLDLLRIIKQKQIKSGIIIVSAKDSLDDKVTGLDLGADDYLTKPFQFSELNSRIKAVLRRKHFDGSDTISFNEISINTTGKTITVGNNTVVFTKKEFELLLYFMVNKNRVLTKESIAEHLWGDKIDLADSFDFIYTHLNNIRRKIKNAGGTDYIQTVYGMGYKFSEK